MTNDLAVTVLESFIFVIRHLTNENNEDSERNEMYVEALNIAIDAIKGKSKSTDGMSLIDALSWMKTERTDWLEVILDDQDELVRAYDKVIDVLKFHIKLEEIIRQTMQGDDGNNDK